MKLNNLWVLLKSSNYGILLTYIMTYQSLFARDPSFSAEFFCIIKWHAHYMIVAKSNRQTPHFRNIKINRTKIGNYCLDLRIACALLTLLAIRHLWTSSWVNVTGFEVRFPVEKNNGVRKFSEIPLQTIEPCSENDWNAAPRLPSIVLCFFCKKESPDR